ncbi:ATP-binding protein [Barnesiella viscericola]|uniref:ATPase AAA n=1 Tax=Barnesiella viscericola DSM 18177 TaxID=880074 RepID=W0ENB2_9BACT|nr:AAA family ATPase [Barnesiella viscericola]AHF12315.1 ATPase AAA [Barnesiella viscericola DSM 18177]
MESFYRTHKYLVEHVESPVKRDLMYQINKNSRLVGIKGSRGVGKTTFLLQYAKENYGLDRSCLYINLNNLYFTEHTLREFAGRFYDQGGRVLLIDQVFKYPGWSEELKYCYDHYPELKIIFSGSSVMRLKEENPVLAGLVDSYNLRGFSFREYLNLMASTQFPSYTLDDIIAHHKSIAQEICSRVNPLDYFPGYLHHGYYPFFLDKANFSENLVKNINMIMEVDILLIKQIELSYLPKVRRLMYLLSVQSPAPTNVSQLSKDIQISRATVMNYIKSLKDARLINMLYREGEEFPKKPAMVYMHNTNIIYSNRSVQVDAQAVRETFFYNTLHKDHRLNMGSKNAQFLVNREKLFRVQGSVPRSRINPNFYYAVDDLKVGSDNLIPLWLFGFVY